MKEEFFFANSHLKKKTLSTINDSFNIHERKKRKGSIKTMKTKASVKADPSKGDKLVRRRGRLYVINKKDPNRKQRQKGPARKK